MTHLPRFVMTFHGSNNGFDYHIVADLGLDDLAFIIRRQRGFPWPPPTDA